MSREKLLQQPMPNYTRGEETFNLTSHIVGGGIGVIILVLGIVFGDINHVGVAGMLALILYGVSAITLYTISSVYHGLHPKLISKRVLRILDHCTIYFLIAGTYTPVCILGLGNTWQCYTILIIEWIGGALGITMNAIDLNNKFVVVTSMVFYLLMGWAIVFVPGAYSMLSHNAFLYLLIGGICYTIGSILYGVGHNVKWFHSIFHIFCDLGTLVQFFAILFIILGW